MFRRATSLPCLILLALLAAPSQGEILSKCLDSFYSSVQQGNSNRVIAQQNPDRPANDIDHYREFVDREGFGAVKIWDATYGPGHPQVDRVMNDPDIDVVVYRPMYNFNTTTTDEQVDYGQLAEDFYDNYSHISKVVILTGWEQDHQLNNMLNHIPGYTVADYRAKIQARQDGVFAAMWPYALKCGGCPTTSLNVFHAVEVVNYNGTVLNQVVAQMDPKPDFVSYSAWGALNAGVIGARLSHIQSVSGLDRDNIFVGEFNWNLNNWPNNADDFADRFFDETRSWGAKMAFLWQFNQGVQFEQYVVFGEPEHPTKTGYVRENGYPVKRDLIDVARNNNVATPCSHWAW